MLAVLLTTELWTGEGIGAEFVRTGFDYDSTGEAIAGSGGFISVEWKATDKVTVTFGGGVDQPKDEDTTTLTAFGGAVPYDANRTVFANIRYQFSKQMGCGFEIMDQQTELRDGATSGDDGQTLYGQRFTIGSWFIF